MDNDFYGYMSLFFLEGAFIMGAIVMLTMSAISGALVFVLLMSIVAYVYRGLISRLLHDIRQ
jgi:uncharacterized integral membrane protein